MNIDEREFKYSVYSDRQLANEYYRLDRLNLNEELIILRKYIVKFRKVSNHLWTMYEK